MDINSTANTIIIKGTQPLNMSNTPTFAGEFLNGPLIIQAAVAQYNGSFTCSTGEPGIVLTGAASSAGSPYPATILNPKMQIFAGSTSPTGTWQCRSADDCFLAADVYAYVDFIGSPIFNFQYTWHGSTPGTVWSLTSCSIS